MATFPTDAESITAEFLSEVLGQGIASFSSKPIGAGLVGDSSRITLAYVDGADGPTSIAAKFPAQDVTSRSTAVSMQLYEKEVGFYRHIAPHIATRTPRAYFAEHDLETGNFLLLMEDCGPAEQGDQLTSCTLEQAKTAVVELARLHGPTFENAELLELPFLQPNEQVRAFAAAGYPGASEAFGNFYRGKIEDDLLRYLCKLADYSPTLFTAEPPTGTGVVHGDFRLDNILFAIRGGTEPMATLDWQTVTVGDPLTDLGYFMGAGIGSALRQASETDLLETYRAEMINQGGPDLRDIRTADGYARGALHGISTAVFSAAFVEHNDRSEAIFQSMAIGAAELARDIDALRVLEN